MIIKISSEDRKLVEDFADKRTLSDSDFYRRARGAFKREDVVIGGLAELGAYKYLKSLGHTVSEPDLNIHKTSKKSFNSDLYDEELNLFYHIKGQSRESEEKYGCSYLCQKQDKLVNNPEGNHYIICCVVDPTTNEVEVMGEFNALDIKWGEPKIDWLKRTKVAMYLKEQTI